MGERFDPERFAERLAAYGRALERREEAMKEPGTEFIRDAIIRRFVFAYEPTWKAMQDCLAAKDSSSGPPRTPLLRPSSSI